MKKKIIIIVSVFFSVFAILIISAFIFLNNGQKEVNNTIINQIDLTNVEDGTYIGEFEGYRWSNKIEVKVANNKIVSINIIDDQLLTREDITKKLFDEVIDKQSTQVDTISGATISCKAYLKAIENALNK